MIVKLVLCILLCWVSIATAQAPNPSLGRRDASIINPLEYGATCTSTTLNAAISGAPSTPQRELLLTPADRSGAACVWAISADVTVPRTMKLRIPHGVTATLSGGITLAVNGPFLAEDPAWWSGTGTLLLNYPPEPFGHAHIVSGCAPTVPVSSLTLAAFSCQGVVTVAGKAGGVYQAAQAVGPLNAGNGTYWLLLYRDTSSAVSGWTRQEGSYFLWQFRPDQPESVSGGLIYGVVTVAGGAITAVRRFAPTHPSSSKWHVRSAAYGAKCDGVTDDTAAFQAALNQLGQLTSMPGGVLVVPQSHTGCKISATLLAPNMASQFGIEGEGMGYGSRLLWYGAAGAPMLKLQNAREVAIRRLTLDGNAGGNVASHGIQIHQGAGLLAGPAPTGVVLEDLDIQDATQCIATTSEVGQNQNNDQVHVIRGLMACAQDGISFEHDTSEWHTIIGTQFSGHSRSAINTVSTVFPTASASFTAIAMRCGGNAVTFRLGKNAVHTNEAYGLHCEAETKLIDTLVDNTNHVGMTFYGGRWTGNDGTVITYRATEGLLEFHGFDISTPTGFTVSMPTASTTARIRIVGGYWVVSLFSYNGIIDLDGVRNPAGSPGFTNLGSGKLFVSKPSQVSGFDKVLAMADSATPPVPDGKWGLYILTHAAPTTVTDFTGAAPGEMIHLFINTANTTIAHNSTIRLQDQIDWKVPQNSWITLIKTDTGFGSPSPWWEIARSERKVTMLLTPTTLTNLGTPANGHIAYCNDCQVTSGADNTCAGSGGGAFAVRRGTVWRCFALQN